MAKKIKRKNGSGGNMTGVIRSIGDNYLVKDTPCLIPKESIGMFNTMRKQAGVSSFGNWPNPYNIWRKQ